MRFPYAYGGRQVLHAAISDDNARTWRGHREVGRDPLRNEVPSNEGDYGTAYPFPVLANKDRILFVSGQGRGRVIRMAMDPQWLLETKQSADFVARAEEWSTFGTRGVKIEPHPSKPGARVLALRKPEAGWPAAAVWNFPSGATGRLRLRVMTRPGFAGALIGLTDHFSTPFDLEDHLNNVFNLRIGPNEVVDLPPGRWHDLELRWSVWQQSCRVLVGGKLAATLPMSRFGRYPSYLRLRSLAEETDPAGLLVETVEVQVSPAAPPSVLASDLRDTALAALRAAMVREPLVKAMHAAEALLWNGDPRGVRERYKPDLASSNREEAIAALRVLAQMPGIAKSDRDQLVLRLRDMAADPTPPRADFAIESLAKVGYGGRDRAFVERAQRAEPIMRILALWVLANSGKPEDETRLAAMLDSPNKQPPGIAAYALRFLTRLRPATVAHLRNRLAATPAKAEGRVYLVSALYLQGPEALRPTMRREMMRYIRTGSPDERYEALLVFGRRASARDLPMLAPYLRHADADTRTAAANSILRILRR